MTVHVRFAAVLAAALMLSAWPAGAQTSAFFTPPKLLRQAEAQTFIAGSGTVRVQVFVHKDGAPGSVAIQRSTNHGDDACALDIARRSTYTPARRDGKPIDAFYTMELRFNSSSVVSDTDSRSQVVQRADALLRASNYTASKALLAPYLSAHPQDRAALAIAAVDDAYLGDTAAAVAGFNAAGAIPEPFRVVAAKAYGDAAVTALKAKNNDAAVALAAKGLALAQSVNLLFIRGTAYGNAQQYPQAIADLERAKAQASAGSADAATLDAIDASLATSYIFGGQAEKGLALALALKKRDPAGTRVDDTLAAYYNGQALNAVRVGNREHAVTVLETAATTVPARAVVLYVQAANVLAGGTPADWKRVKAEVDKALAIDPSDARANYVAGVSLANGGNSAAAMPYLRKAQAAAGTDAVLSADITAAIKKLNP